MNKGNLEIFKLECSDPVILKPVIEPLKAGSYGSFPSAALDFPDESIDFLRLLIRDPATTFPGRVSGNSLKDANIYDKDLVLIDKSLQPFENDIVAAIIDGEFFIKRFRPTYENNRLTSLKLKSENPDFEDLNISSETEFTIWGVITWTLTQHRNF